MAAVPTIDVTALRFDPADPATAAQVDAACRATGCFRVVGQGVPDAARRALDDAAREFFALSDDEKSRIAMVHGGRAWRGWFPLGGELTSGVADQKEGLYFGTELGPDDPRVTAGLPLHGPNLFPVRPTALREAVLDYLQAVTEVGQLVLGAMAVALGLDAAWFATHLTTDPTVLFRIFRYPPLDGPGRDHRHSVGEHTDYGLLTLLGQDGTPGLEFRTDDGWVAVDPDPSALVVNLGDMLERMTAGRYRSTVHRVRNTSGRERLSFPLFLDPDWDAAVRPLPVGPADAAGTRRPAERWDGEDPHLWSGTYGEYLRSRVARVFPDLAADQL